MPRVERRLRRHGVPAFSSIPGVAPAFEMPRMSASLPPAAAWSLEHHAAACISHGLRCTLDLDQPRRGLVMATAGDGGARSDHLLGIELRSRPRLADHWIRGGDLTAVYEPADARRLRATAMWRMRGSDRVAAWELVVSAQTGLEQSDSAVAVVNEVTAAELLVGVVQRDGISWAAAPAAVPDATGLLLLRNAGTSVVIAVHPTDRRRVLVTRSGSQTRIECWLFSSAIEKGVLLRSRVLAAVGPTADDIQWAADLVASFHAAPPVLTT